MAQEGRRGLGRGLSALLGENEVSATLSADPQPAARVGAPHMAPIELLHPNPDQPRKVFSEAERDERAASMREKGVIQPLLVRPTASGAEYEIVAGERRWRAAQRPAEQDHGGRHGEHHQDVDHGPSHHSDGYGRACR